MYPPVIGAPAVQGVEHAARLLDGRLVHAKVGGTPILDDAGEFRA